MKDTIKKFKYVALGTIAYVFRLKAIFARALLIPFFLYLLLDMTEYLEPIPFLSFSVGFAYLIVHTLFAITTHRIVLLGRESTPKWGILNWSKRETKFVLHMFGLGLMVIPLVVLGFVPVVGMILFLGVMFWFIGRLSLVFPAIAIDQGISFKYSWELTRNYQFLMVLVVIVFPLLLLIPSMLISMVPYTFIITSTLSTLSTVFMVTALSITYREICEEIVES
jgi:hypothetical protein